ncbi:MAG: Xaa-Pro peptidase family protein [Pseudomonadota bacterium]
MYTQIEHSRRGFSKDEYLARLARAQELMSEAKLGALLLTTEPEVRYFSGFLTRFWESPTRPWFLVVPAEGMPVAVIPEMGAAAFAREFIGEIRTWPSPRPSDEGISLVADTAKSLAGRQGRIGVPMGTESHLRMPLADWGRLAQTLGPGRLAPDAGIMRKLRLVKSEAEIEKIRTACAIGGRSFARLGEIAAPGVPLDQVFRQFQALALEEGADWVAYLAGAAGPAGYSDVISLATEAPLAVGDVLMLDTGIVHDGYYCDFDRNVAIGEPASKIADAHARLVEAVDAGAAVARPGASAADLFQAMAKVLGLQDGGDVGRLGHGLGMQLTEWPSLIPSDRTVLHEGMVLTLEPAIAMGKGRVLVHEENIVIRADGPEFLSPKARAQIPVIGGAA